MVKIKAYSGKIWVDRGRNILLPTVWAANKKSAIKKFIKKFKDRLIIEET